MGNITIEKNVKLHDKHTLKKLPSSATWVQMACPVLRNTDDREGPGGRFNINITGLILVLHPANERWCCFATSLIDWAQA